MKKHILKALLTTTLFAVATLIVYAQTDSKTVTISAKDLYEGMKNKSLRFTYGQEMIITGILENTGSSIVYNSGYLLISDKEGGHIYVKAVLADKRKRSEYKKGQIVKIRCHFYEERSNVVVVKDAKNE